MSTRPHFSPYSVITAGDMSGNLTSSPTIIQKLSMISYAFSWSGSTPVGTVSLQVSNDFALNPNGTVANSGTWTTLVLDLSGTPATAISLTGNTGSIFIDVDACAAYAIRAIYTFGSGTGTMQCVIAGKVS